MREKMSGIYAIENRLNKRVYVGLSNDIFRRWEQHLSMLEKGHHHSFDLQSDYDELGVKHFAFYILELCEEEKLKEREIYWISKLNAETDGYNMTEVAYKPPALLDAENKQLKDEIKKLTGEVRELSDRIQELELENKQITKEKEKVEKEFDRYLAYSSPKDGEAKDEHDDELYWQAYSLVIEKQTASVSLLQRHLRIGYTRAARLMDQLEQEGVVGPWIGSMPRKVLIREEDEK